MDTNLRKHTVIVVIALLFFTLGYVIYAKYNQAPIVQEKPHPQEIVGTENPPESSDGTPGRNVSANIVTYTDNGYVPSSLTVKKGETVVFKNNSAKAMWPASAKHPTHEVYDGTTLAEHCAAGATASFDSCRSVPAGGSYSFTFDKAGKWFYHDHLAPAFFGSITVTE